MRLTYTTRMRGEHKRSEAWINLCCEVHRF